MRKKVILRTLVIAMAVSVACACGDDNVETESTGIYSEEVKKEEKFEKRAGEIQAEEMKSNEENQKYRDTSIKFAGNYNQDVAWLGISDKTNGEFINVMVDKKGNAILQHKFGATDFFEGYSNISDNHKIYIVDTKGAVLQKYDFSADEKVLLSNAGYVVTEKEISDFDMQGYQYTIYNRDGSILEQFVETEYLYTEVTYCGKGVFYFKNIGYYFAESGKWFEGYVGIPEFKNDVAVCTNSVGIYLVTVDGKVSQMENFSGSVMHPSVITDDICVLYDTSSLDERSLVSINISTGEQNRLPSEYGVKLWEEQKEEIYKYQDGRIVAHLEGADGNGYIAVFDAQMNLVFGPVAGYAKAYSDERMVLTRMNINKDGSMEHEYVVYDTDGNILFSLSDQGLKSESVYSDGVLVAYRGEVMGAKDYTYVDRDGNILFEKINFENVVVLE